MSSVNPSDSDVYASESSLDMDTPPSTTTAARSSLACGEGTEPEGRMYPIAPNGFAENPATAKFNDKIRKSKRDGPNIHEVHWLVLRGKVCGVFSNETDVRSSTANFLGGLCQSAASKDEAFASWDRAYAEGRVGGPNLPINPNNHVPFETMLDTTRSPKPCWSSQHPGLPPSKIISSSKRDGSPSKLKRSPVDAACIPVSTPSSSESQLSSTAASPRKPRAAASVGHSKMPMTSARACAGPEHLKTSSFPSSRGKTNLIRPPSKHKGHRCAKVTEVEEPLSFWYVVQSYPIDVYTSYMMARGASVEQGSDILVFDNEYQAQAIKNELKKGYEPCSSWDDDHEACF